MRRKRNKVEGIFIDGDVWCVDGDFLHREANKFFKGLFAPQIMFHRKSLHVPHVVSLNKEAVHKLLSMCVYIYRERIK